MRAFRVVQVFFLLKVYFLFNNLFQNVQILFIFLVTSVKLQPIISDRRVPMININGWFVAIKYDYVNKMSNKILRACTFTGRTGSGYHIFG